MRTYLAPADVELMEQAATSLRDRLLIRLLFRLGCRVSEALAIGISDIDFARGTITILHLKRRIKLSCPKCKASVGKRHRFCPECGTVTTEAMHRWHEHKRIRVLPVDKHTLHMLDKYITSVSPIAPVPLRLSLVSIDTEPGK